MNLGILILAIIAWILLFIVVYKVATRIEEHLRQLDKKKLGIDSDDEKKTTHMYIIAFFVGIPLLFIIALIQEILS